MNSSDESNKKELEANLFGDPIGITPGQADPQ